VLGVAERRNDRVEALSLGNQQRVQLAAAPVHDPEVLILDEPFSGLDPVAVDALSAVLQERARAGAAVLFSSHQLELVERLCEAVTIVVGGRIVASGPVEQLRREAVRGRVLRVEVDAAPDWAARLEGVEGTEQRNGALLLRLREGADEQAVLDAARAAGPVRYYARVEPSLTELFREAVSS
jgi:ABC-2 type transport system ATP-binding protein